LLNETNIKYEATTRYQFEVLLFQVEGSHKTCWWVAICRPWG